ncbi:MAG TPA: PQQ-dependent sugar dehydrogenase [Limnobacter sp.]|uniref:PQQ-dependent sugar dehydrogenase n=1 Tax=Limnobacter sp. TaxID=2003368 RepID=UPI002ED7D2D9
MLFRSAAVCSFLIPLALWAAAGPSQAQVKAPASNTLPTFTAYTVTPVADNLENPWSLAFLPDGRQLVTERSGRLRIINAQGQLQASPVAGLPAVLVAGQGGLFDVVPAPDFSKTQQLLISYACGTRQANHTCLASARLQGNALTDVKEIFRSQPAKAGGAHFGGRVAFLPDGTLVMTLGDGYDYRDKAQDLSTHFGKTVRLNRDGSVPADNPFANRADARPEIYTWGHRNVQGLVWDGASKRLLAHEHGARGGDELNLLKAGANYGWPLATYGIDYSGAIISPNTAVDGTEQPQLYWNPSIAPSGMAVYNGGLFPAWQGSVLVGALSHRMVQRIQWRNGQPVVVEGLFRELNERIRDVKTGPDGAVYLLTDQPQGRVLKVTPSFSKTMLPKDHPLVGAWRIDVPGTSCYEIYDMRADGTLRVVSGAQQADAEFSLAKKPEGEGFYKWTNKITNHNQQPDCMGTVMQTGHEATFYITFHSTGDQFLLCEQANLSACFGPFVRQPSI